MPLSFLHHFRLSFLTMCPRHPDIVGKICKLLHYLLCRSFAGGNMGLGFQNAFLPPRPACLKLTSVTMGHTIKAPTNTTSKKKLILNACDVVLMRHTNNFYWLNVVRIAAFFKITMILCLLPPLIYSYTTLQPNHSFTLNDSHTSTSDKNASI